MAAVRAEDPAVDVVSDMNDKRTNFMVRPFFVRCHNAAIGKRATKGRPYKNPFNAVLSFSVQSWWAVEDARPYKLEYPFIEFETHQTHKVWFIPKCGLNSNLSSGYKINSLAVGAHAN